VDEHGNQMITNKALLSMVFALGGYVIFFIAVVLQINEMKYNFALLDFLIKWKNKSLLPLSVRNTKKLTVIINAMSKLLMKQAFWPLVIFWNSLAAYPMIMTYLEPKSNFMVVSMIFFQVCFFVFSLQYYCIVCTGFVAWSVSFFYLIFKFKEIHQDIQQSIKHNNSKRLSQAIINHHQIVIQTQDINHIFKWVVFILYYVGSPTIMMLVCICQIPVTDPAARPILGFVAIAVYSVIFYLNFVSSQINHSATKPRNLLYRYLMIESLSRNHRLKVIQFIEHLAESEIGFHCNNIFLLNSYTFYNYVSGCACTYFLILNLYKDYII
jgi:hypothetical protein